MDITKKFSAIKVVGYWSRLPRELVNALSLEMLKVTKMFIAGELNL